MVESSESKASLAESKEPGHSEDKMTESMKSGPAAHDGGPALDTVKSPPNNHFHPTNASTQTDPVVIVEASAVNTIPDTPTERAEPLVNEISLHRGGNGDPSLDEEKGQVQDDQNDTAETYHQWNHLTPNSAPLDPNEGPDQETQLRENGFIKLNTHDISVAAEKVPNIKSFANDLQTTVNLALSSGNKSRYKNVYVLLISWADDDLKVDGETTHLGDVFSRFYHFDVQQYKIPRKSPSQSTVLYISSFIDQGGIDSLLIVYYAGHAYMSDHGQPPIWAANGKPNSPTLPSGAIQQLLEEAKSDVLLLYDSCHSSTPPVNIAGQGVTEIIAACAHETQAPPPGPHSFTNALTWVLEQSFSGPPIAATEIHCRVMNRLKTWKPDFLRSEGRIWLDENGRPRVESYKPRTPVHFFLTNEKIRRVIILTPLTFNPQLSLNGNEGLASNLVAPTLANTNGFRREWEMLSPSRKGEIIDIPEFPATEGINHMPWHYRQSKAKELQGFEGTFPDPLDVLTTTEPLHVLLAIRLEEDLNIDDDDEDYEKKILDWCEWLKAIPQAAKHIKIQGIYKSYSTIVLLSLPVSLWDLLPNNPAYSYIGFVDPRNLALTPPRPTSLRSPAYHELREPPAPPPIPPLKTPAVTLTAKNDSKEKTVDGRRAIRQDIPDSCPRPIYPPTLTQPEDGVRIEKPIKFTDSLGRRYLFPYNTCKTYTGFTELIKQAFRNMPGLDMEVALGHYDVLFPRGVIVLPQVWDDLIEPGLSISMSLWPKVNVTLTHGFNSAPPPRDLSMDQRRAYYYEKRDGDGFPIRSQEPAQPTRGFGPGPGQGPADHRDSNYRSQDPWSQYPPEFYRNYYNVANPNFRGRTGNRGDQWSDWAGIPGSNSSDDGYSSEDSRRTMKKKEKEKYERKKRERR